MTRDMDLIRALLLRVEGTKLTAGNVFEFSEWDEESKVDGYTWDEIYYNLGLVVDRGLVAVCEVATMGCVSVTGLTWEGHEFLDTIRNPEVWNRTKAGLKKVGGVGLDLALALAKAEGKRFMQEKLGIALP